MEKLSIKNIFIIGLGIRVILFAYGYYQDNYTSIKFSDLDYQVVNDGARYVYNFRSPFERHTYRYTPLLAIMMTPNIFFNINFGKFFLIFCDILVGFLIQILNGKKPENFKKVGLLIWFLNPLTVLLSVRGSFDVIMSVLILITLILVKNRYYKLGALVYGVSIHFKIYPIIYCIFLYLYIMHKEKK